MEEVFEKPADSPMDHSPTQTIPIKLVNFDPDEPGSDIENWCTLCELIIKQEKLSGNDLILALTLSLKGRAAIALTEMQPDNISWDIIKDTLMAKFSKPMVIQNYFDDIMKFKIGNKENPAEAGMRLWQLIEKIPEAIMPEKVIIGFVVSVLSRCGDVILKKLNSQVINDKNQLYQILQGLTLKRRNEDPEVTDEETKRVRNLFRETCSFCGEVGHCSHECIAKLESTTSPSTLAKLDLPPSTSFSQPSVIISSGPVSFMKEEVIPGTSKQGNANFKAMHGILQISGIQLPFLFDTGSECSLIRERHCTFLNGKRFHEQITLKGVGGGSVVSTLQIKCSTVVQGLTFEVTYLALPDKDFQEEVLLGRDILNTGMTVELNKDYFKFINSIVNDLCETPKPFDSDLVDTDLTGKDRDRLMTILMKYSNCLIHNLPTTFIRTGEFRIDLIDPTKTVPKKPYEFSVTDINLIKDKIQELLDAKIIRESSAASASPIRVIRNGDGRNHICVDYREVNSNTRPDKYPFPLVSSEIAKLHGARYYSSIDMASSFHQFKIHRNSVAKTAFITPVGQYEFLTMPRGLRNAPKVFQRAMNYILRPFNKDKIVVYVSDILSASESVDEGLLLLDCLLNTLSNAGFMFNFKKCSFMKLQVEYRGFRLPSESMRPYKVLSLQNAPKPTTASEVKQLINLSTYFRHMIPNYSKLIEPLNLLTSTTGSITWTLEHDKIHNEVIKYLISKPPPKITDPSLSIELHTNANSECYGSVLIQKCNNDPPQVIAYLAHRTSDVQSGFHSIELETLAILESMKYFRQFIYGRKFTIVTDCHPLVVMHSNKDWTPKLQSWWASMESYDFDIVYKKSTTDTDGQSLKSSHEENSESKSIEQNP